MMPTLLTRFLNLIIDLVVVFILYVLLFSLFVSPFIEGVPFQSVKGLDLLVLMISLFEYYGFMEYKYQKTVGKFLTKTQVVNKDGKQPQLKDILIRTACRLIPIDAVSFLFTKDGLHDSLSKTTVVKAK